MRRLIPFTLLLIALVTVVSAAAAQEPFDVHVYVDRETLTLHVPSSGIISLEGISFQVLMNDNQRTFELADYPAFGLPFDQLPTPICFRIRLSGSRIPLPQACSGALTLTQDLAAADVFWYDAVAETSRVIMVMQSGVPFTICPSGASECTGTITPLEATSTPTLAPTLTPVPMLQPFDYVGEAWQPYTLSESGAEVSLYLPSGWVYDEAQLDDGTHYLYTANRQHRLDSMLNNSNEPRESGELSAHISLRSGVSLAVDGSLNNVEAILDWLLINAQQFGSVVRTSRSYDINGKPAISLSGEAFDFDFYQLVVQIEPGWFLMFTGSTVPGELDDLIPFVDQIADSAQPTPDSAPPTATVNLNPGLSLRMRVEPSEDSSTLALLPTNTGVEIIAVSVDGAWYRVRFEGLEGWIAAQYTSVSGDVSMLPHE